MNQDEMRNGKKCELAITVENTNLKQGHTGADIDGRSKGDHGRSID
jgi:hypothetical protein